jgi:hypothetical protein
MTTPPLTILCVNGWCRNGSTIIGNVLGEVPGVVHVGELHFLWKNSAGRGANNLCGCGAELTQCPLWSRILPTGRPPGVSAAAHAAAVAGRQQAYVRTRHTWRLLRHGPHSSGPGGSGPEGSGPHSSGIREHAELMTGVYHAIAEQTGARVIVDTTKIPGEAALLPYLDGVTPYYVHLVRDPRAVAQSWSRQKEYVYVMPSWKSTAYWHGFNLASEAISRRYPERSLFLRYEDFTADPAGAIDKLLRFCGIGPEGNPVAGDRTVELHTNHTVTGNPDRFRSGRTVIRDRDDAWRDGLPSSAKLAAMTLSWPLAHRYGYRYEGTFGTSRDGNREVSPSASTPSV